MFLQLIWSARQTHGVRGAASTQCGGARAGRPSTTEIGCNKVISKEHIEHLSTVDDYHDGGRFELHSGIMQLVLYEYTGVVF